jgi:hypothetical protein
MAAATPATEMGIFRQFAFATFLTSLDAYMAVVSSDHEGKIAISHDVEGNRIRVADEDGETVQTLMRDGDFGVQGETVTLPVDEVWVVDPKVLEGLEFEDYVDEEHGLFGSII